MKETSHQFDAAIKILDDAVVNNKTSAMYRPAQRFLEAGKGVDMADKAIEKLSEDRLRFVHVINLLKALPDKEGGK